MDKEQILADLPTWRMFLEGHFAYKSGTCRQKAGRFKAGPTLRFFLEVYSLQKSIAFQNTLWHGDSAAVPFGIFARNRTEFP